MGTKHKKLLLALKDTKYVHIRTRLFGVKMVLIDKNTVLYTAEHVGKTERTVYNWLRRYKQEGIVGLKDKPGRGRKPLKRK